jgi:hypothetical protein
MSMCQLLTGTVRGKGTFRKVHTEQEAVARHSLRELFELTTGNLLSHSHKEGP